jgi:hypothetical protein
MSRFANALSAGAVAMAAAIAVCTAASVAQAAMSDADKAALKDYTATCRGEIKEQAKYQEMSWYAQHKAVKNCVKDLQSRH